MIECKLQGLYIPTTVTRFIYPYFSSIKVTLIYYTIVLRLMTTDELTISRDLAIIEIDKLKHRVRELERIIGIHILKQDDLYDDDHDDDYDDDHDDDESWGKFG